MTKQFIWNEQQKNALEFFVNGKGHGVFKARAGCTKTTVAVEGLKRAKAARALYVIFNKKNQLEAYDKIIPFNKNVAVKTFHSTGYTEFVLRNWRGVTASSYTEFGRAKSLFPEAPKQIHFQVAALVKYLKNLFINPTLSEAIKTCEIRGIDGGNHTELFPLEELGKMALKVIEFSKTYPKDRKISWEDQFWLPVAMGWVRKSFDLIVIDECQDMNLPQMTMARGMLKDDGRMILVGDDKQAIYYFRGSMSDSIDYFKKELKAVEFPLNITYRCPKKVVKLAQALVPDIQAHESAPEGEVNTINYNKAMADILIGDVILSRTNAPLMRACLNLIKRGTTSYVVGKDVAWELKDIAKNLDAINMVDFLDKLEQWKDKKIQNATGWTAAARIEYIQDVVSTLRMIAETCLEIGDIDRKIDSLFIDEREALKPGVICSTVHKAKGLEWDSVNLLSESFKTRRGATAEELAQENNIYYVGITRAKNKLNLVSGLAPQDEV